MYIKADFILEIKGTLPFESITVPLRAAIYTGVLTSDQEIRNQLRDLEQFRQRK